MTNDVVDHHHRLRRCGGGPNVVGIVLNGVEVDLKCESHDELMGGVFVCDIVVKVLMLVSSFKLSW